MSFLASMGSVLPALFGGGANPNSAGGENTPGWMQATNSLFGNPNAGKQQGGGGGGDPFMNLFKNFQPSGMNIPLDKQIATTTNNSNQPLSLNDSGGW